MPKIDRGAGRTKAPISPNSSVDTLALRTDSAPLTGGEIRRGGWILVVCTLGMALGTQGGPPIYTIGIFMDPLTREFGWTRTQLSFWSMCLTLGSLAATPLAGWVIDRWSAKRIAAISICFAAPLMAAFGLLSGSVWSLYGLAFAVTFLGIGASALTYTRILNTWFDRRRGFALGTAMAGIGAMSALTPPALIPLVDAFGWRVGFAAVGLAMLAPLFLVLTLPDDRPGRLPPAASSGVHLREATGKLEFWVLAWVFLLFATGVSAVLVHLVPFLTDGGLSRSSAARLALGFGLASLTGRLGMGLLIDRVFAPRVALLVFATAAVGLASLAALGAPAAVWAVPLVGFAYGSEVDLIAYMTMRYFGLVAYARVMGVFSCLVYVGIGLGPILAGVLRDANGGYAASWWASAALVILAGLGLVVLLKRPFPRFSAEEVS